MQEYIYIDSSSRKITYTPANLILVISQGAGRFELADTWIKLEKLGYTLFNFTPCNVF